METKGKMSEKNNTKNLRSVCEAISNIQYLNICVIGVPEGVYIGDGGMVGMFQFREVSEEIKAKFFSNLIKTVNPPIQEI